MANPSSSGADAAYDRAAAAFDQSSYDVARRWALEALALDSTHARARTLLARLDAVRRPPAYQPTPATRPLGQSGQSAPGPEVVSTDPTILISRASRPEAAEPIEPTILVRRDAPQPRRPDTDVFAPIPVPRPAPPPPVSEPTFIQRPARAAASAPKSSFAFGTFLQGLKDRMSRGSSPAPSRRTPAGRGGLPPGLSGVAMVVAAILVAALFVWGAIAGVRWLWPAGQALTVTRPTGGTIVGPGIECGTRGSSCSTTRPTGDPMELTAEADTGYVWSGFTGDCAPAGRFLMSQPRTCGATFDKVSPVAAAVTLPLTVTPPTGGTIIGAGGILCGTLGSNCSANVPNGAAVTLRFEADSGYTFQTFTGDCSANGEMTMTTAKTCGATFTATSTPVANVLPPTIPIGPPRPRRPKESTDAPVSKPPVSAADQPLQVPPPVAASSAPTQSAAAPTSSDKPAAPPISAEDHAKNEIQQLIKNYCAEYETLDPQRVRNLFPLAPMAILKDEFRQYKTLKCTITSPPEFDRLDASAAGGAQVKYGMKHVIQMRSGGAPVVQELNITMVVSRIDFQSRWLIDRVRAEVKPK